MTIQIWNFLKFDLPEPSVAEPPLFWAAPGVRGPGADSGPDQIGSAPAQNTNSFHFELLKSESVMQVLFRSHLPL